MRLRSSILAGIASFALFGLAQAAGPPAAPSDTPSSQTPSTAPMPADTAKTAVHTIKLSKVHNPRITLRGAAVKDSKGDSIGEVKSVRLSKGKVTAVNVTIGTKTVALKADTLSYAQADNTLISTQTKAEIGTP